MTVSLPFSHNMKRITAILVIANCFITSAAGFTVRGSVFMDSNRNGIIDKGEKGICGILVSNGEDIVKTDCNGRYSIKSAGNASIFPILKGKFRISTAKSQNSAFKLIGNKDSVVNFGLERRPDDKVFTLNAVGDVQVGSPEELEYADRSIFTELMSQDPKRMNIFMGDEVNERMDLLQPILKDIGSLPQESWTMIGNHDRDDSLTFDKTFGARNFAFERGNFFFIMLDNVFNTGKRSYRGHLTERQLNFISNCISYVKSKKHIVLCAHIPFWETDNFNEVVSMLKGRGDVLAISAHLHEIERHITEGDGVTINEVSVGAACGHWWTGERNWEGVPDAIMNSGAPRGYFVFNFNEKGYSFRFKGIGLDPEKQMSINISGIDNVETQVDSLKNRRIDDIYITVFGGCDSTLVKCKVDDGKWMFAKKINAMDANVAITRELNKGKAYPSQFSKMNPLRRLPSKQLWYLGRSVSDGAGTHHVEIIAYDRYGFTAKCSRTFSNQ